MINQSAYDDAHLLSIEKIAYQVRKSYLAAIKEISALSTGLKLNANGEFYFLNNSAVNKAVNEVISQLYSNVYSATVTGIQTEWDRAVEKNNAIAEYIYGKGLKELPAQYKNKYLSTNAAARKAFVSRVDSKGFTLSDRVWDNSKRFKTEIEIALENGIGSGKSADALSREVRKYLNDPLSTTRTSQKARLLNHPGQGVYRSAFKNAQRLTRNETNFSYEASQKEKRAQQDFIVGIRIQTSPSHNTSDDKGGVCCSCLQGDYPKNFDFTYKWHVNCKCFTTNIIKTDEELAEDTRLIIQGLEPTTNSKNAVNSKPKVFVDYKAENTKKWEGYKSVPRTFAGN